MTKKPAPAKTMKPGKGKVAAKTNPTSSLTAKQEAFCQAIVSGMSQADAYRKAYNVGATTKPETVQKRASELMANGVVSGRVVELRKPVVEKLQYGLHEAMKEAEEAFVVAKGKENGGAMVAAVTLRAKLQGLLVERKEIKVTPLQELPEAELDKLIVQKAREAGVQLH